MTIVEPDFHTRVQRSCALETPEFRLEYFNWVKINQYLTVQINRRVLVPVTHAVHQALLARMGPVDDY